MNTLAAEEKILWFQSILSVTALHITAVTAPHKNVRSWQVGRLGIMMSTARMAIHSPEQHKHLTVIA